MVRILINQIGYDSFDYKKAILQITSGEKPDSKFEIIDEELGQTVFAGPLISSEPVARWNKGDFYLMDFSSFQPDADKNYGRSYRIQVEVNGRKVLSIPFEIYGNVLEYKTLSSVMYYFKSQRVTGEYEVIDRNIDFKGPREGRVDMHGGWNDATGDIGVHLTHQSKSGLFNVQQGNLAVFVFYKFYDLILESSWDYYAIFNRRIIDEATYGADWLMRRRAPSGSFFKAGPLRLPDAYELPAVTRHCGFEYKNTITPEGNMIPESEWKITDESYEASIRGGGGFAAAALAMAARHPYPGAEFSASDYLQAAKNSFLYLERNNERYTKDGKWNIIDDYSALEAAVELYKTSREHGFMTRSRKYANKLIERFVPIDDNSGYLRHDDTDRPFFSPAEEGMPVLALLDYTEIEKDSSHSILAVAIAEKIMRHLLSVTHRVSNPFGYAREYIQDRHGNRREQFFFPHDNEDSPWWQGENARILSLASAARKLSDITKDHAFKEALKEFADDQVAWVLGMNPFDSCMMIGRGCHNPEYFFHHKYDFIGVPSGIVNGITSAIDDEEGIAFIMSPSDDSSVDDNWRWAEEWLPHAIWYIYALALKRR